jgi:hypothetical protein
LLFPENVELTGKSGRRMRIGLPFARITQGVDRVC